MSETTTIQVLTLKALAKHLGKDYGTLRNLLTRKRREGVDTIAGYRFFGEPNKAWFAYDAQKYHIQVIGEGEDATL